MRKYFKPNYSGSVVVLIIIGIFICIVALIFGLLILKPVINKQTIDTKNSSSKIDVKKACKNRDYGGCDEEKNFYQWKDDGKP